MSNSDNDPGKTLGHDSKPIPNTKGISDSNFESSGLPHVDQPSSTIGPYTLLQKLGEGGMGAVWTAQQEHPVKRRVALKLIKTGVGSHEILARFDAERQALALMDHANIARILDAGTTESGQPYFVMELVTGTPLTTYCDQNRLSIDDRLKLFTDVCAGVQHAHQKGIIHRDLKPGNIIVGMQDGKPVPKIIDFGLAKAMEHSQQLTDQSLFTGIGQILGTLKYMSPEQASLDSIDIDTRTDIYALGIILYELLTGSTPLDDSTLKGQAVLKVLEVIRDKEPVKPSSKLGSSTAEARSSLTNERRTDSVRLNRILAGDLDWIVMKALEKNRTRRYESASGFADDVQRYLNSEPVIARPPSLNYRIGKFVRKNRAGVIAASLVTGALLVGIMGTSWGMVLATRRAEGERIAKEAANVERVKAVQARMAETIALKSESEQRRLAEVAEADALVAAENERIAKEQAQQRLLQIQKSNEMLGSIFEDLDIQSVKEGTEPLEAVLAKRMVAVGKQLEGNAIGDPLAVAALQERLGVSLNSLGFASDAIGLHEQAFNTRLEKLGNDHLETLDSMNGLASAYLAGGKLEKALSLSKQASELSKAKLGVDHPDTLASMDGLAQAYDQAGELEKALPLYEQTLKLRKAKLGIDHPDTLLSMNNLALGYKRAGDVEKALPLYGLTLDLNKAKLGDDHPNTLNSMNNLAQAYQAAGNLEQALPLLKQTLDRGKAKLGSDHPQTLTSMNNLALAYDIAGDLDKALPLYEQTLKLRKSKLGIDHPLTLQSMQNLASAYQAAGELDKALPMLEETLEMKKAKLGADHPNTLVSVNDLAIAYQSAGESEKAMPLFQQTLEKRKAILGADHPDTLVSMNSLAYAYYSAGELDKVLPLLEETLKISKAKLGSEHPTTLAIMNSLAVVYQTAGEINKALTLHEETLETLKSYLGADHPQTLTSMNNLAAAYQTAGEIDKAVALFEQTLQIMKVKLGTDHPNTLNCLHNLADAYAENGMVEKSIPMYEETLQRRKQKLGDQHPDTLSTLARLGNHYLDAGRIEKSIVALEEVATKIPEFPSLAWARGTLRKAYSMGKRQKEFAKMAAEDLKKSREIHENDSMELADELVSLGEEWLTFGDPVAAEPLFRECFEIRQHKIPADWRAFNAQMLWGTSLAEQQKWDAAKPLLEAGYTGLKANSESTTGSVPKLRLTQAVDNLIKLATKTSDEQGLKKWTAERAALESSDYPR